MIPPIFINNSMKDFKQILKETIIKQGENYTIKSKKGKILGKYENRKAAIKRLEQIEWFKRHRSY